MGKRGPMVPEILSRVEGKNALDLLQIHRFISIAGVILVPHLPKDPGSLERVVTLHINTILWSK